MSKNKNQITSNVVHDVKDPKPSDFEDAMDTAGFGVFNILLLLVALPAAIGTVFETSTMSYILPSAECDLNLTLLNKGVLNAITYAGMITSAIAWGYVADTKGRKKILVLGYLADSVCVLCGAMSQNVVQLMVAKYFGGFVMCGPFAVLMTYLSELHGKQYRARVMMICGMMFTTASLMLPILALTILPYQYDFRILGLSFHSWQLFLAVSAIPSILCGTLLTLFPESPKFLMSQGRNDEAMEIFRKIYAINKRQPKDTFPIKELIHEVPEKHVNSDATNSEASTTIATIEGIKSKDMTSSEKGDATHAHHRSTKVSLRDGILQLRPLFAKPYLSLSLQVYLMNFCILLGQNTMRLWLPQLFASINEYEHQRSANEVTSMCAILEYSVNKTNVHIEGSATKTCEVLVSAEAYTNNIIVALSGFIGYIVAGVLVNVIGVKRILTFGLLIAGTSAISMYWSSSSLTTLIISSFFVTVGSISSTSVLSASLSLFPTSLRTMVISLVMMFGRCGSLLGNVLFPMFMSLGCIPPFLMISLVMFFASFLSAFLPIANRSALK